MLKKTNTLLGLIFLALSAPWCAQGQTADQVNQTGRGRYTAADDFQFRTDVEFFQPDYKFESALPEGFGRATAAELGVVGMHFWNEYPGQGAALVTMAPDTVLIYDTVSRQPLYVTGCHRDGRNNGLNRLKGMNRIKPVAPPPSPAAAPPPPAQPAPATIEVVDLPVPEGPELVELAALPPTPTTTAGLVPSVTIPKIRFCDTDRDGWRPDRMVMGMVEKVRCEPGHMILDTALGGLAGWGMVRAFPGPLRPRPVVGFKNTPAQGVLSPP